MTTARPHSIAEDRESASAGLRGWRASLCTVGALLLVMEIRRWMNPGERQFALTQILCGPEADALPFLPWLAVGWLCLSPRRSGGEAREPLQPPLPSSGRRWSCPNGWIAALIGLFAFWVSWSTGREFTDEAGRPLPPAYHDEYSYLLQADTFLAGRIWTPGFTARPELFDQMHVLNEGRFASRYFPGVGAWLAPCTALGNPWLAQHAAQGLAGALLYLIGCSVRGPVCGATAGVLFGVSPGLMIFSNLLLAHSPTLVGLLLFLWAFLQMRRAPAVGWAVTAGCGLAFAMLCRPMTAAGFALPEGAWCLAWLARGRIARPDHAAADLSSTQYGAEHGLVRRLTILGALAAPLLAGFAFIAWYSWSITGDPWTSPYQLYTDVYTPRHVYGFHNVVRGEQHLGPKVLDAYDRWAENLTPALAAENVLRRTVSSLRLTLGIAPLLLSILAVVFGGRCRGAVALIVAGIATLHLVHIPYWFAGIMDWHYVLETAPLWLLLAGIAASDLFAWSSAARRRAPRVWWAALLSTAVLVNSTTVPLSHDRDGDWLLWRSRLRRMIAEVRYPRVRYADVHDQADALRNGRRAIVFVIPDPADRSMDYVTNSPFLDDDVLWARRRGETAPAALQNLARLFPDRLPLLFDAASGRLRVMN